MRYLDGSVYLLRAEGTAMASFSSKSSRLVVSVYQDDRSAFVYPMTTKKPGRGGAHAVQTGSGTPSYVVTDRGLFEVSIARLQETGWRYSDVQRLDEQARKDLRKLEIHVEAASSGPLTQTPFLELKRLKKREVRAPKERTQLTDQELFESYLRLFDQMHGE